ncbi:S8 family peptidase [Daejeonella sp.]|uniref:S8 family peptidase n=1 Tax=Daejeonella sp. TaxID=2805397 RepID=UPI003982E96E
MNFIKKLLYTVAVIALPFTSFAQSDADEKPKENWQNLDLKNDGVFGISTEKAYNELLKGKTSKPVIVAVIDGGIDEKHEDLKQVMWVNPKEIAANGIDDDKNGYIDDIHGWNFLGKVHHDNMEVVRLVNKLQPKYAAALNSTPFSEEERKEFQLYKKLVTDYMARLQQAKMGFQNTTLILKHLDEILVKMGKTEPTIVDFNDYKSEGDIESQVVKFIKPEIKKSSYKEFRQELEEGIKHYDTQIKYHLNLEYDPRKDSIGDNYANSYEKFYGNNDITGPDAEHGSHVAGIIGAVRSNNLGIKGIADNVKIMALRTVPDGDERDKDVANSIRYAVDNGAKIINMSFGKAYSWDKKVVDEAVKYAVSRDVLLVHAAGNDGKNTEKEDNVPNRLFADSTGVTMGNAEGWIEVGASGWKNDEDLVASFSNYGGKSVDVFAPGVKINSTMPDSKYKENDGTSMASPVVAGLAALIRSYYPQFTAVQVKDIIMNSVTKVDQKVKIREEGNSTKVPVSQISVSGGVVNAYNALILAEKTNSTASVKSK